MPNADESRSGPREVNLEAHPLVDKLHPNPDEIHNIVALVGYLGPSRKDGCVRLYSDLTFRNYYEIPTSGILATAPINAGDENSPTSVHVSADTVLEAVSISSQSVEARYVQGSIASGHLGSASAGAQAAQPVAQGGTGYTNILNCGAQAGDPAAQMANAATFTCVSYCCQGAQPPPPAAQAANAATFTCVSYCCQGAQAAQPAAQAAGTWPTITQINCGPAQTFTCRCVGAGAQAGQANVGAQMTLSCWGTCYPTTCGEGGMQAAQPAAQMANAATFTCVSYCCQGAQPPPPAAQAANAATFTCVSYCCQGAQAAQPVAQAAGTWPTVTQINCGPAQTVNCQYGGAGAQAGQGGNAPNYFTQTCWCTLIGGPCP